ncbi:hypothetical protein [Hoeflea sp.]|uniref:hypothetical protein n=1 Tax=Hoeflea sp. TaxID=1940281 RepID=UPI0037489E9F
MPLLVTVDLFSGRENPSFVIGDDESRTILSNLEANQSRLAELPRPSVLGYRGFRVTHIAGQNRQAPDFFTASGPEESYQVYDLPDIEKQLMELSGQALRDDNLQALLSSEFERTSRTGWADTLAGPKVKCPPCNAADAPAYDPAFWNTPARQPHNNCYNYANNQATNTFAQPGRATGKPITALSCKGVQPSAQSDGLKPCANFSGSLKAGQGWYVALVIWPGRDYHWYRQDNVGCWSHKPGQTAARNTDSSGNQITDPKTCDRGPYIDFCTYMITNHSVTIK